MLCYLPTQSRGDQHLESTVLAGSSIANQQQVPDRLENGNGQRSRSIAKSSAASAGLESLVV